MTLSNFKEKYIKPFGTAQYIWAKDGYIVWRNGTGMNVELLHIRAFVKRKGIGTKLFRLMLEKLKENPPYYSVYGFSVGVKRGAVSFYRHLGFHTEVLSGPYKKGESVLFYQSYKKLYASQKPPTRR
jgi:GNAT superfamily N-acetyltransferase